MRKLCAAYWLLLTLLLLSSNPLALLGNRPAAHTAYGSFEPIAHLVSFAVLAIMVLASRWPVPRGWVLAILAAYGVATEAVQSQIPGRSMQLADIFQDFAGVLAGSAVYWLSRRLWTTQAGAPAAEPVEPVAVP